jgi:16S rRNA (guanine527-N7)-methyltransferase
MADGARKMGIPLTEDQLAMFQAYYDLLVEWNSRVNLTRITDHEEVQVKHFLDSLSCLWAMGLDERTHGVQPSPRSAGRAGGSGSHMRQADAPLRAIDVGSGAGFPGIPLKIAVPALWLVLLEATGKKAEFLQAVVQRLHLSGVEVINTRAEEAGQSPVHRERYDLALGRALAGMATLAELTLPLVRVGGTVIAQKGEDPTAEVEAARKAIAALGGQVREVIPAAVPGLDAARHLVVLEKVAPTPAKYPRRPGIPAKRPLT